MLVSEAKSATPTNGMNEESLNNSEVRAEQVAKKKRQTIKLGLDVHADWIVVVRLLDHSGPQPAQKFTPGKFLEWVKSQLALSDAISIVVMKQVLLAMDCIGRWSPSG